MHDKIYGSCLAEPLGSTVLGGVLGIAGFLIGGLTQYNFGDAEVVVTWAVAGPVARLRTEVEATA